MTGERREQEVVAALADIARFFYFLRFADIARFFKIH